MATPGQVLATLAALAPDSHPAVQQRVRSEDMVDAPLSYARMFEAELGIPTFPAKGGWQRFDEHVAAPLAKRAKLHEDEALLRLGWLWVHGVAPDRTLVRFPLVSMPVRHAGEVFKIAGYNIKPAGDPELTDFVTDSGLRHQLDSTMKFGGGALSDVDDDQTTAALLDELPSLKTWAVQAAAAAGFETQTVNPTFTNLDGWAAARYEVVARVFLYVAEPAQRQVTIASTLRSWPESELDDTAFARAYGLRADAPPVSDDGSRFRSPIVLSPRQESAVMRSRTAGITVISGPPGSGKTQTIAAIALDAVQRGQSVLVAAPSEAAVEALIELMQRVPGPDPIVFGSSEQRVAVADRLGQGGGPLADDDTVRAAKEAIAAATDNADALYHSVHDLLAAEVLASGADPALVAHARSIAPKWFERDASLTEAQRLLHRAQHVGGLFRHLRRELRQQKVVAHAGGMVQDMQQLERALHMANASRQSLDLETSGGLDLTSVWPRLIEAEENRRVQHGRWLNAAAHAESRVTSQARSTMALVAAALRAGRSARRDKLGEIDGERIADALPLWVGTLRDIDDLLPRTPAMFDLVIVDEASQVDQVSGAPAMLRARRAVVVGDPRQLRHVSFLSDEAISTAIAAQQITDATAVGLLDVRRLSLFDLAASAAPTIMLDEHFRSAPHLIGFSARHFYGGAVSIATMHPRNHCKDCITVETIAGMRDDTGVNAAEVDRVIAIVRQRLESARAAGELARVGIVTPFRAQADAIEQRVVDEFSLEDIDTLALRVGTVHGFQGCERDLVIISLALDADSASSGRGFVSDANLFNVMITRAREEIVVVTSLPADSGGIVGDYIRYGSVPPAPPAARGEPQTSVAWIAGEIERGGVEPLVEYPAGRHTLELVFGAGDEAVGVTIGVHPDGPEAHIERRLALQRAGWEITEAFDTKWGERRTELAVELILDARRRVPG
jgi:hypothetical protein